VPERAKALRKAAIERLEDLDPNDPARPGRETQLAAGEMFRI